MNYDLMVNVAVSLLSFFAGVGFRTTWLRLKEAILIHQARRHPTNNHRSHHRVGV